MRHTITNTPSSCLSSWYEGFWRWEEGGIEGRKKERMKKKRGGTDESADAVEMHDPVRDSRPIVLVVVKGAKVGHGDV